MQYIVTYATGRY